MPKDIEWICPLCRESQKQPAAVTSVYHECSARGGRLTPLYRPVKPLTSPEGA